MIRMCTFTSIEKKKRGEFIYCPCLLQGQTNSTRHCEARVIHVTSLFLYIVSRYLLSNFKYDLRTCRSAHFTSIYKIRDDLFDLFLDLF